MDTSEDKGFRLLFTVSYILEKVGHVEEHIYSRPFVVLSNLKKPPASAFSGPGRGSYYRSKYHIYLCCLLHTKNLPLGGKNFFLLIVFPTQDFYTLLISDYLVIVFVTLC